MEQLSRLATETMGGLPTLLTAEKFGNTGSAVAPIAGPLVGVFVLDAENYIAFGRSCMTWVYGRCETMFGYTDDCALEQRDRGKWKLRVNKNLWLPVWPEVCESREVERIVEFMQRAAEMGH